LSATLESMGLLQINEFDELYSKTLDFLGGLGGVIVEPRNTAEEMDTDRLIFDRGQEYGEV